MVSTGFYPTQEDTLSPLARLQKYWDSDNVFNRQMVARNLLDTLRAIFTNPEELEDGLKILVCLSEDIEPMVRSELMEQIPHLAMFCSENKEYFPNTIQDIVLPTVVRYLTDANNQVRKTSQAALLVLLEQELIDHSDMVNQVCPVIIQLSSQDSSDDYRTEAVALMSKVAPLAGREITERFFLPHFTVLCKDSHFHLRKVCAANIGDICNVVGQESTESELLPRFEALCLDGVWGVRKSCAECFMTVSWAVSGSVRKERLSPLFVQLLCDQSRWVRMAAFQNLGPFISTFADPSISGVQLVYNPDGTVNIRMVDPEESVLVSGDVSQGDTNRTESKESVEDSPCLSNTDRFEIQQETQSSTHLSTVQSSTVNQQQTPSPFQTAQNQQKPSQVYSGLNEVNFTPIGPKPVTGPSSSSSSSSSNSGSLEDAGEFNSFLYWRNPIDVISVPQENDTGEAGSLKDSSIVSLEEKRTDSLSQQSKLDESGNPNENLEEKSQSQKPTPEVVVGNIVSSATFSLARPNQTNESESTSTPEPASSSAPSEPQLKTTERKATASDSIESISAGVSQMNIEDPSSRLDGVSQSQLEDISKGLASNIKVGEASLPSTGVSVHRAEVSEAVYQTETVSNIGTTRVIGASLDDKEVGFVNGVVEEEMPFWSQTESSVPEVGGDNGRSKPNLTKFQNVIPEQLLEQYLSMTDPARAQTVDTEIAKHCAFSLPGVALTLGRQNWPCLKDVYDTLASDMQWKVRRTLAFSIHEMALILGDEITSLDLVPIFNGFLKDLDEVRIGVLKHFADFVKLLKPQLRQQYLNRMNDFLTTDNQRNWRFRLELAEQLIDMCEFYSPREVYDNILHIAIELACDRVADVRFMAYKLISRVTRIVSASGNAELVLGIVEKLKKKFAESQKWFERQAFVHICQKLIEEQALDTEQFATDFLPAMLDLSADPIPNVRITLARTLAQSVMPLVYFTTDDNPSHERLIQILSKLADDEDVDVGYYSRLAPIGETTIPDDEPPV